MNNIPITHTQKYLVKKHEGDDDTIDLGDYPINFIKSNMGTGKSDFMTNELLAKIDKSKNVLIISFR